MLRLHVAIRRTMKNTITIISILFSFLGYCQESTISPLKSKKNTENTEVYLVEVAKIPVSPETTVHTYTLKNQKDNESQISDMDEKKLLSKEITDVVDIFLSVEGVTECSFDEATQSLTIITGPLTDLSSAVKNINTK